MECLGYHATRKDLGERIEKEGYKLSSETSWLGTGVYFWETDSIFDGYNTAYWWAKHVKQYDRWVVFKAVIRGNRVLDLAKNPNDQSAWERFKSILQDKHVREGNSLDTFRDYFVVKFLVERGKLDFIRAVMSENPTSGYITHIVYNPRLVINVINTDCIVKNQIVREGM